jgi:hypothetical protein
MPVRVKSFFLIGKMVVYLVIYLNTLCCIWMFTVDMYSNSFEIFENADGSSTTVSMQWYPPLEDINYVDSRYFELHGLEKYTYTFYYAVLIFGYNDLYPRNPLSYACLCVLIICSVVFINFYISDIVLIFDSLQRKQTNYQMKYDQTNEVMGEVLNLDEVLKS